MFSSRSNSLRATKTRLKEKFRKQNTIILNNNNTNTNTNANTSNNSSNVVNMNDTNQEHYDYDDNNNNNSNQNLISNNCDGDTSLLIDDLIIGSSSNNNKNNKNTSVVVGNSNEYYKKKTSVDKSCKELFKSLKYLEQVIHKQKYEIIANSTTFVLESIIDIYNLLNNLNTNNNNNSNVDDLFLKQYKLNINNLIAKLIKLTDDLFINKTNNLNFQNTNDENETANDRILCVINELNKSINKLIEYTFDQFNNNNSSSLNTTNAETLSSISSSEARDKCWQSSSVASTSDVNNNNNNNNFDTASTTTTTTTTSDNKVPKYKSKYEITYNDFNLNIEKLAHEISKNTNSCFNDEQCNYLINKFEDFTKKYSILNDSNELNANSESDDVNSSLSAISGDCLINDKYTFSRVFEDKCTILHSICNNNNEDLVILDKSVVDYSKTNVSIEKSIEQSIDTNESVIIRNKNDNLNDKNKQKKQPISAYISVLHELTTNNNLINNNQQDLSTTKDDFKPQQQQQQTQLSSSTTSSSSFDLNNLTTPSTTLVGNINDLLSKCKLTSSSFNDSSCIIASSTPLISNKTRDSSINRYSYSSDNSISNQMANVNTSSNVNLDESFGILSSSSSTSSTNNDQLSYSHPTITTQSYYNDNINTYSTNTALNLLDVTSCLEFNYEQTSYHNSTSQLTPTVPANLRGGSIDALIVLATSAEKKDFLYQEAFITTYRTMIEPKELIYKLLYRYRLFNPTNSDQVSRKASKNSFSLLVRVLDELGNELTNEIIIIFQNFVIELLTNDQLQLARILRKKLLNKIDKRTRINNNNMNNSNNSNNNNLAMLITPASTSSNLALTNVTTTQPTAAIQITNNQYFNTNTLTNDTNTINYMQQQQQQQQQIILLPLNTISSKRFSLLDFKSADLAEQMTLTDLDLFLKIELSEVLLWSTKQSEELSPNLTQFTEHFNNISYWTRSRILEQENVKERERFMEKFLKVMKHLRKMNNFNSYLAILSAVDSGPVQRLDWPKYIIDTIQEYSNLIDPKCGFKRLREAVSEAQPPCIPHIGLILQDLTILHIANSDYLPSGNCNFWKRWQQFNILERLRYFRNSQYNFKRNIKIINFFNNFNDFIHEEAQYSLSEHIKPKNKY